MNKSKRIGFEAQIYSIDYGWEKPQRFGSKKKICLFLVANRSALNSIKWKQQIKSIPENHDKTTNANSNEHSMLNWNKLEIVQFRILLIIFIYYYLIQEIVFVWHLNLENFNSQHICIYTSMKPCSIYWSLIQNKFRFKCSKVEYNSEQNFRCTENINGNYNSNSR